MIYKFLNNKKDYNEHTIFISIMFGLIIGVIVGFDFTNTYNLGLLLSFMFGVIMGFIIYTLEAKYYDSIYITTIISLTTFEIMYEIINETTHSLWIYTLIILIITEILFLLDKTKPNTIDKDNIMKFTTIRKIEAFIEATIIFVLLKIIYYMILNISQLHLAVLISNVFLDHQVLYII